MKMSFLTILLVAVPFVLAIAAIIQRRLSAAVQPVRLQLAEKGEELLARHDIPRTLRADVEDMLDDPFPCNCFLAFLLLPFVPLMVWGNWKRSNRRATEIGHTSDEVRAAYIDLRVLNRKVALANHPLMVPAVDLVATISMIALVIALVLARKSVAPNLDRDSVGQNVDHAIKIAQDKLSPSALWHAHKVPA